jgi:hypothetical protein
MRLYVLTEPCEVILDGEVLKFTEGVTFNLAGLELSTMTSNSPFHYLHGIIRLPNKSVKSVTSVKSDLGVMYGSEYFKK